MTRYRVTGIEWYADDKEVQDLPSRCFVELGDLEDPYEDMADILSDRYGFCVFSCNFEETE